MSWYKCLGAVNFGSLYSASPTTTRHLDKTMSNPADIQKAYDTTVPKLKDALAADRDKYDCTSCRVIGCLHKLSTIAFKLTISL